jgi:hypothetical protein
LEIVPCLFFGSWAVEALLFQVKALEKVVTELVPASHHQRAG